MRLVTARYWYNVDKSRQDYCRVKLTDTIIYYVYIRKHLPISLKDERQRLTYKLDKSRVNSRSDHRTEIVEGTCVGAICFRSRHPVYARRFYSPEDLDFLRRPSAPYHEAAEEHCPVIAGTEAFTSLLACISEKSEPRLGSKEALVKRLSRKK